MVTVDFWTSNVSPVGPQFLTAFAPAGDALGPLLDFRLHFFVVEMPASTAREDIAAQCYREDRRYCTPTLETEGAVKGSTVLEESVRQLCLLNGKSMTKVWWRYLEDFSNTCAARTVDWEQCSYAILKQVKMSRLAHPARCI
ncbi:MAG: hypothetical protein KVP17_000059 [Porospora cf. gigantea B]|uniref:uncharacterized protein n=1 Tax=Porospora cf. gigantea B TaxID=2853592 RepID=UPI0035718265|nr:MAG: hypothetical protein KVP17_000059 [Porospora cf. gigantea B]